MVGSAWGARVPEHARHQVHVEWQPTPRHISLIERRAPWREDLGPEWTGFPVARLRYTTTDKSWTLYWRDRNARYHLYDQLAPTERVEPVVPRYAGMRTATWKGTWPVGSGSMCPLLSVSLLGEWWARPTARWIQSAGIRAGTTT